MWISMINGKSVVGFPYQQLILEVRRAQKPVTIEFTSLPSPPGLSLFLTPNEVYLPPALARLVQPAA